MEAELGDLGRFAGPATLILSSLAGGSKHGYALAQDIETFAGVRLQPGTLYGAISRLDHQGLIEALAGDGRRRPYRLSAHGAAVLQDHLLAQREAAEVGLKRLSAGWSIARAPSAKRRNRQPPTTPVRSLTRVAPKGSHDCCGGIQPTGGSVMATSSPPSSPVP